MFLICRKYCLLYMYNWLHFVKESWFEEILSAFCTYCFPSVFKLLSSDFRNLSSYQLFCKQGIMLMIKIFSYSDKLDTVCKQFYLKK